MKSDKVNSFWPSYTDLMTSLFFIMLVLFVLVFTKQQRQIKILQRQVAIINAVEENLKPLKKDSTLFTYEEDYKRFKLSFDVKFERDKFNINKNELSNFENTITSIKKAGEKLKEIIEGLKKSKEAHIKFKDVSYILVIAGYASKNGGEIYNYELSYRRALALRNYWRTIGIDFESPEFSNLIDLQISGNGWGGIGRLENDVDNQRFLIQIFPKIGDIK